MSGEKLVNDLERELRILCEMESQDRPKAKYHAETRVGIAKAALLAHVSGLREQLRLEKADYLMSNEIVKDLRAENERLKADLAEARRVSLHDDVKYVQLERVNAELRAKLKSIVDVIESRTEDGLTRFCADPACNCESSGAYQDLKALEKGEASTADRA